MSTPRATIFVPIGLLALILVGVVGRGSIATPRVAAADANPARVKALLQDKHATLQQLAAEVRRAHEAGLATSDQLYVANVAVLRAEVELQDTDAERAAVLEKLVAAAQAQEEATRVAVEAGRVPPRALWASKVDRLDAEIARERARSK